MKVSNLHRVCRQSSGDITFIATFDLELSVHVRMFGLRLMETRNGKKLVYSPNGNGGRRLATFSPELAAEITKAAMIKFEGQDTADGKNSKV